MHVAVVTERTNERTTTRDAKRHSNYTLVPVVVGVVVVVVVEPAGRPPAQPAPRSRLGQSTTTTTMKMGRANDSFAGRLILLCFVVLAAVYHSEQDKCCE
ncbi:unnamed protein product [Heligmosomoides polygyrus]|uniref:Secreted protein n=1 Tax=Heligmosomoides polygyrus TaxID=6339 RepID=A0A183FKH9_HELPZ|nr:unnamed protein product [Heligmosomoides polygyrus]